MLKYLKLILRNLQCYVTPGSTSTYHKLLFKLYWGSLFYGFKKQRTENKTFSLFAQTLKFDISNFKLPLLQSRKVFFRGIFTELCWMLNGLTNVNYLKDRKVTIWNQWADESGELGPVYGKQFVNFGGVHQINELIDNLKKDPYSRRHVVSLWNVPELKEMALPPCHYSFQCLVNEDHELTLILNMRSMDYACGTPFNIVQYATLAHILAEKSGYVGTTLVVNGGDVHIYENQIPDIEKLLLRSPVERFKKPTLAFVHCSEESSSQYDYNPSDYLVLDYNPNSAIRFPVVDK